MNAVVWFGVGIGAVALATCLGRALAKDRGVGDAEPHSSVGEMSVHPGVASEPSSPAPLPDPYLTDVVTRAFGHEPRAS